MALDVEAMLTPLSTDAPCGVDLRHEPQLLAMIDDADKLEDENDDRRRHRPDWARVRAGALELSKRGRDLRVLLLLVRAQLAREGVPGFAEAMTLLRRSLERWWEDIHPSLDLTKPDPVERARSRLSLLAGLNDPQRLLFELRRTPLVEVAGAGRVSYRDFQLADGSGKLEPDETRPERKTLEAILKGDLPNDPEGKRAQARAEVIGRVRAGLDGARSDVEAIETLLKERLGDATAAPSFGQLKELLSDLAKMLPATAVVEPPPPPPPGPDEEQDAGPRGTAGQGDGRDRTPGPRPTTGRIESREDVLRALDQLLDYYRRREPSSPVPLLLQRAKRLVPLDFLDAMADLAPGVVPDLKKLAGLEGGSG